MLEPLLLELEMNGRLSTWQQVEENFLQVIVVVSLVVVVLLVVDVLVQLPVAVDGSDIPNCDSATTQLLLE